MTRLPPHLQHSDPENTMISAPQPHFPNSTELINMAHREWKSRQERKGLNDEAAWVSGWISGYLTNRRMDIINSIRSRTLEAELKRERERLQVLSPDDIDHIISYIESCCYWNTDTPIINKPHVQVLITKLESLRNGVERK
jgi:hypothetical protein